MTLHGLHTNSSQDEYLLGRPAAWFAFAMSIGLMLFDYIDRQVIVSLFPYMKADWGLSDAQLGALVSVVSVTVALGALPVALLADRYSRVKSIVAMATVWSLATISCMFSRNYGQLLAARAVVGLGEAGYGSVGSALIATLFPARMRSALLAAFFAAASVGSVLGVLLGGVIAARWGWQAAFGVVGVPGLVLALLYLKVRDYRTVELTPGLTRVTSTTGSTATYVARTLLRSRTLLWVCLGGASQLIVVSAVWAWLPSFLNRFQGMAPDQAALKAALVVLCGAVGSVVWGTVIDRTGTKRPRNRLHAMAALVVLCGAVGSVVWGTVIDRTGTKRPRNRLHAMAALCVVALLVLMPAFAATGAAAPLAPQTQFLLIAAGGFLMTCTVGPVSAVVIDVVHPGVRATGASVLALFQNLFGLAAGPFVAGLLSDAYGLQAALAVTPAFGLLAAGFFFLAARSYEADIRQLEGVRLELQAPASPTLDRKALA